MLTYMYIQAVRSRTLMCVSRHSNAALGTFFFWVYESCLQISGWTAWTWCRPVAEHLHTETDINTKKKQKHI